MEDPGTKEERIAVKNKERRDMFAAAALTGILSNTEFQNVLTADWIKRGKKDVELVEKCYRTNAMVARTAADALLKELDNPTELK